MNIAYTDEYIKKFNKICNLIFSYDKTETNSIKLSNNYTLNCVEYTGKSIHGGIGDGAKCTLLDISNNPIYEFDMTDLPSKIYFDIIHHENGSDYFIFKRELYGYSVLDINSLKSFHYIPDVHINDDGESFIWADIFYNRNTNILAVEGCFWACPYSIILLDFSNPMTIYENQIPIEDILNDICVEQNIDLGDLNTGDINFKSWNKDNSLTIIVGDNDNRKEISITSNKILEHLAKK